MFPDSHLLSRSPYRNQQQFSKEARKTWKAEWTDKSEGWTPLRRPYPCNLIVAVFMLRN